MGAIVHSQQASPHPPKKPSEPAVLGGGSMHICSKGRERYIPGLQGRGAGWGEGGRAVFEINRDRSAAEAGTPSSESKKGPLRLTPSSSLPEGEQIPHDSANLAVGSAQRRVFLFSFSFFIAEHESEPSLAPEELSWKEPGGSRCQNDRCFGSSLRIHFLLVANAFQMLGCRKQRW